MDKLEKWRGYIPDDEIAAFVPLMARFVAWTDDSGRMGRERFAEEIAEMSTDLKKTAIAS